MSKLYIYNIIITLFKDKNLEKYINRYIFIVDNIIDI